MSYPRIEICDQRMTTDSRRQCLWLQSSWNYFREWTVIWNRLCWRSTDIWCLVPVRQFFRKLFIRIEHLLLKDPHPESQPLIPRTRKEEFLSDLFLETLTSRACFCHWEKIEWETLMPLEVPMAYESETEERKLRDNRLAVDYMQMRVILVLQTYRLNRIKFFREYSATSDSLDHLSLLFYDD